MTPPRLAKALCALAAIVGLVGLTILPPEHVHSPPDHDGAHHAAVVHRHFAAHHQGGVDSRLGAAGQGVQPDDDEHSRTIPVVVIAGTRYVGHHAPAVAIQTEQDWLAAAAVVLDDVFARAPPPHPSPPASSLSLRGPPQFS